MGILMTIVLGIVGSLVAGCVGRAAGWYAPPGAGWIASIIGAIVLLVVVGAVRKRTA